MASFDYADTEVQMISSYDFMYAHNCSLDIGNSKLKIGNRNTPFHQVTQNSSLFRICLDKNVLIPPGAEMIIDGKIVSHGQSFKEIS